MEGADSIVAMAASNRLWSDFSFVVSSSCREKVLTGLADKPRLPSQLAEASDVRLVHVSRALRELSDRGLTQCLTPEAKARGRLYGLTDRGLALLGQIRGTSAYGPRTPLVHTEFVPKIRASSVRRVLAYLRQTQGDSLVRQALRTWSVDADGLTEDTWLSVASTADLLDLIEKAFGDGSYGFIRTLFARAVASFPTVQEQLSKAVPLTTLARSAPLVYGREWNFGRLEVEVAKGRVVNRHIDWMPTPAMCSMFHGIYEGVLRARNVDGKVTKTRCVRSGDPYCEYVVEW